MTNMKKIVAFFLAALILTSVFALSIVADESSEEGVNRYNVVFVTDESGSMAAGTYASDPNGYRYEAIRQFVAYMAMGGNRVGFVSFDYEIRCSKALVELNTMEERDRVVSDLSSYYRGGTTNIGLALNEAVRLLDEGRNPNLPSVIILLTDGKTSLGEDRKEEEAQSLILKADAIERAKQAGYEVYSIYLHAPGVADAEATQEMMQIAKATGGEFREVSNVNGLADVEAMFYQMIFNAIVDPQPPVAIKNGSVSEPYIVPVIGVEELNVTIKGEMSACELVSPSGKRYSTEDLQDMMIKGNGYCIIKVVEPEAGEWIATAFGNDGAMITFQPLINPSIILKPTVSSNDDCQVGDVLTFKTLLGDNEGVIENTSLYAGYEGKIHISVNGAPEEVFDMTLGKDGFRYEYTIQSAGTIYAYMTVEREGSEVASTENYRYNIDNTEPVVVNGEKKAHAYVWPFFGGKATVDLSDAVTDADGDTLTYTVDSTSFMLDDYTIEGSTLTVHNFSLYKGSFTIRATDAKGAYCTFDISFSSTNVGIIIVILIAVGALIVFGALLLIANRKKITPFVGDISVELLDPDATFTTAITESPRRGQFKLRRFGIGEVELPKDCYFQAGGRKGKCIYLIAKKPVYSSNSFAPSKKIKINGDGAPVTLSATKEMSRGVIVRFYSHLNNNMMNGMNNFYY